MFPRVKDIIKASELGAENIKLYFNQEGMNVDPNTWAGRIKKDIDNGHELSVMAEIELIQDKFNNYNNVSKEDKRTGINSVDD